MSAALGTIIVAVAGFIGFEGLKHFQKPDTGTYTGSGSASNPYTVNTVRPTGNVVNDAKAFASVNGVPAAPILAIVNFESSLNQNAVNNDCANGNPRGVVCRGYLQVNENVYGPAPLDLASQLAIPGIGDRIIKAIKKYGSGWSTNFLDFWKEAQGGSYSGTPEEIQRAQQSIAFGMQNG